MKIKNCDQSKEELQAEIEKLMARVERLEKVNHLLSNSFIDGVSIRENGKNIFTSINYLLFLNYPPHYFDELSFEQYLPLIHEKELSKIKDTIAVASIDQIPELSLEYRICNALGKYIWVETKLKFDYDQSGNPFRTTIVTSDITQRKNRESNFEQSEAKFRFLTEHSSDVIWHLDKNYCCDYISLADEKLRGYTQEEVIGTPLFDILRPEAVAMLQQNIAKRIANEKAGLPTDVPHYELEEKCKDGSWVWVEATANPEYDENGNSIGLHGVTRNISERKKAEFELKLRSEQLVAAIADKDRFMSILAHDLRSPFSSILGVLDHLSHNISTFTEQEIHDYISITFDTAKKTFHLLEDLLLWGQAHSGKMAFQPQELSLNVILDEIIAVLNSNLQSKEIVVNNHVDKAISLIADSHMVKTILRNLISNAIKFTHRGGIIELNASCVDSITTISVSDNGIGIKPEILENLFCMKHIYTSNGTDNESGTGLGLFLCKEFVDKHGGTIWAENRFKGESKRSGARISFTIPPLLPSDK